MIGLNRKLDTRQKYLWSAIMRLTSASAHSNKSLNSNFMYQWKTKGCNKIFFYSLGTSWIYLLFRKSNHHITGSAETMHVLQSPSIEDVSDIKQATFFEDTCICHTKAEETGTKARLATLEGVNGCFSLWLKYFCCGSGSSCLETTSWHCGPTRIIMSNEYLVLTGKVERYSRTTATYK